MPAPIRTGSSDDSDWSVDPAIQSFLGRLVHRDETHERMVEQPGTEDIDDLLDLPTIQSFDAGRDGILDDRLRRDR